jgi:hypothetical protein
VQLVAFGDPVPVVFDINTVPVGILRIIPAITDQEIQRWQSQRAAQPFTSVTDFETRVMLNAASSAALKLE